MTYTNDEKLEWVTIFIYEFAKRFGLTIKEAFAYLHRFKAIDYIDKHYGFVHTQSFESIIDDMVVFCKQRGGKLA